MMEVAYVVNGAYKNMANLCHDETGYRCSYMEKWRPLLLLEEGLKKAAYILEHNNLRFRPNADISIIRK